MTTPERLAFGPRVRVLRQDGGWTQAALGRRAGLHRTAVVLVELGRREPSLTVITKLAGALGVPVGQLFPPAASPMPRRSRKRRR